MTAEQSPADPFPVSSPDGSLTLEVTLPEGHPHYQVKADGDTVVAPSPLGFELEEAPSMRDGFSLVGRSTRSVDETWSPAWGTESQIRNHFHEQTLQLQETEHPSRRMNLVLRAYDNGVAFRIVWPEQPHLDTLRIASEETCVRFTDDHTCWWIPDDYDSYERLYAETPLSAIRERAAALSYNSFLEVDDQGEPIEPTSKRDRPGAVNTPLTLRSPDEERYLALHEAALTDYAGMTLQAHPTEDTTLCTSLVPWPDGLKVKADLPHRTPWRFLQIAETPGELIESHLRRNLNAPSQIEDPSWIRPLKYIGIWWGMHIDRYTWDQSGTHGATTERAKRYIDVAAEHDIDAVLVEGWNEGWGRWKEGNAGAFDVTQPYSDFDLEAVVEYGKKRGVALIGHHETGGDVINYERQMEEAFALYERLGVPAVKIGYVGSIRPEGQHHHGQWMVNHYRRVVELAAEHQIMVNLHEPIQGTGVERTWPHLMTREGVRGMEYNAWSEGNPPNHTVTLPFTRMLAGPLDYTPGIFDLTPEEVQPDHRVRTTLAKQLANMVVLYSPLQMASDLIENYEGHDAFEFIERVPVDWSESRVLNARIGEYVTIARRGRGGDDWYVGSTTNADARSLEIPLDMLEEGKDYVAHVFEDAPDADYVDAPHAYRIRRGMVTCRDVITADLARSGGQAVALVPAAEDDRAHPEPLP